jgi:uncharacterized membrane protein YidH (DUF202 family)
MRATPDSNDGADARNQSARFRTEAANERTFQSYARTALGFAIAGAGSLHFLESRKACCLSFLFLSACVVILAVGAKRYFGVRKQVAAIPSESERGPVRGSKREHRTRDP